jgi:hypothetical protein
MHAYFRRKNPKRRNWFTVGVLVVTPVWYYYEALFITFYYFAGHKNLHHMKGMV